LGRKKPREIRKHIRRILGNNRRYYVIEEV
jgi:hypothetical protein